MQDIIGDIHGHAKTLTQLLKTLGYKKNKQGAFHHPTRTAIFVGDFIDRGPMIRETLEIVRLMMEVGSAKAVMGNHEYNALCYHTTNPQGVPLRSHTDKNTHQHEATLKAFEQYPEDWKAYLKWFMDLPLWLEEEAFRVVHATWDSDAINEAKQKWQSNKLNAATLQSSAIENSWDYNFIELILKGKQIELPDGQFFHDKDGHRRTEVRTQWWKSPVGLTYAEYGLGADNCAIPLSQEHQQIIPYPEVDDKPVFIGHYWLRGAPRLQSPLVCCTDYSVAKGGALVAYRWSGEVVLDARNFVFV